MKIKEGSCFFGHKWTKWEGQPVVITFLGKSSNATIQKRNCIKCGKIQTEDI